MNKKQQAEYRKNEWKEFRLKILETDNYTCCRCNEYYGETPSFLNVHHNTYYRHRKPWDYPIDTLTTLCRKCHAQEHGIIIPDSDAANVKYLIINGLSAIGMKFEPKF